MQMLITVLLLVVAGPVSHGAHLRVVAPFSMPLPLPPAQALAFFATPSNWQALSKLHFQLGAMITPSVNTTAVSACGEDIEKPATCGWTLSYQGRLAENYTDFTYSPGAAVNFTLLVGFGSNSTTTNTERNSFWCTTLPDGNCELHRMVVAGCGSSHAGRGIPSSAATSTPARRAGYSGLRVTRQDALKQSLPGRSLAVPEPGHRGNIRGK